MAELTQASELEASMDKHPVTPGGIVPTRELLGDLLLQLNRPAQALKAYQANACDRPESPPRCTAPPRPPLPGEIRDSKGVLPTARLWKAMPTVKPRKSRKRRIIWVNDRSVAAFA